MVDYRGIRQGNSDTWEGICMGSCLENFGCEGNWSSEPFVRGADGSGYGAEVRMYICV